MSAIIKSKIDNELQELLKTAELAVEYGDESTKNMSVYASIVNKLNIIQEKALQAEKALSTTKDLHSQQEFEDAYKKLKPKVNKRRISQANKEIVNQIQLLFSSEMNFENNADGTNSEDFYIDMESEICDKDPITKIPMVDPVKNRKCGHHYERATIHETIERNRLLRCPVAGCGNTDYVRTADLVEDLIFARKLRKDSTSH